MKKLIRIAVLILLATIAWNLFSNPDASTKALLKSIAESEELKTWIAEHPVDQLTGDAKDTLVKTFPVLEKLMNKDNWKQSIRTTGLDLLQKYMDGASAESRENAQTLGAILKILSPDLAGEINAILGK